MMLGCSGVMFFDQRKSNATALAEAAEHVNKTHAAVGNRWEGGARYVQVMRDSFDGHAMSITEIQRIDILSEHV